MHESGDGWTVEQGLMAQSTARLQEIHRLQESIRALRDAVNSAIIELLYAHGEGAERAAGNARRILDAAVAATDHRTAHG